MGILFSALPTAGSGNIKSPPNSMPGRQGLHRSHGFAVRLGGNSQQELPRLQHIPNPRDYARAYM